MVAKCICLIIKYMNSKLPAESNKIFKHPLAAHVADFWSEERCAGTIFTARWAAARAVKREAASPTLLLKPVAINIASTHRIIRVPKLPIGAYKHSSEGPREIRRPR